MKSRSRKGCLTCRERKIKCDEQTPICGQCSKADRQCQPPPAVVFRHQQNASLNSDQDGLEHFFGYRKTFDAQSVWVTIPKYLTFVHITDPFAEDIPDGHDHAAIADATEQATNTQSELQATRSHAFPAAAAEDPNDSPSSSYHGTKRSSTRPAKGSVQNLSYILNNTAADSLETTEARRPSDHALASSKRHGTTSAKSLYDDDEEVAFLLRNFARVTGHWMDLFDLGRFFEMDVIVRAARCPLLLYSAIALSAKSLGQMHRSSRRLQEAPIFKTSQGWLHTARTYYDRAINHLRQALAAETQSPDQPHSDSDPLHRLSITSDLPELRSLPGPYDDELVGTSAILCVYEFLDVSSEEWSRHLDGAKTMFDITRDGVLAAPSPAESMYSNSRRQTTSNRVAIFWNMVRQDMLDAFIKDSATRLDTEDLGMWQRVGLHISADGFILPSNDLARYEPMQDDMICNALVWLAMQVVNFVAAVKAHIATGDSSTGNLAKTMAHIITGLDTWQSGLPDSFRAVCATHSGRPRVASGFPEKWFVRPMCASTIQWHHFLRIMLLHAQQYLSTGRCIWTPDKTAPLDARLLAEAQAHAREIVGITLAQTDEGMLVHSSQPLFAAGQIMRLAGDDRALDVTIHRMRWIERETGWAMEYRIRDLLAM